MQQQRRRMQGTGMLRVAAAQGQIAARSDSVLLMLMVRGLQQGPLRRV